jgi:hypothetical protein
MCLSAWAQVQACWSQQPAALQQAESLRRDLDALTWRADFATMARELRRRLDIARDWAATFERGRDEVFGARGLQAHCERAWHEFMRTAAGRSAYASVVGRAPEEEHDGQH